MESTMSFLKSLALAAALAGAIGCSDDTKSKPGSQVMGDGGSMTGADAAPMADGGVANPDGAVAMPDGALTSIGLVDFVTGLVNGSTNATAAPATIDDKTIIDSMDPAAFDKLLGP
jgi:hypothetical protein